MSFAVAKKIGAFVFALVTSLFALRHASEPLYRDLALFITSFLLPANIPAALFSGVQFKLTWSDFDKLWWLNCLLAVPASLIGLILLDSSITIDGFADSLEKICKAVLFAICLTTMYAYGFNLIWCEIKKDALRWIKAT